MSYVRPTAVYNSYFVDMLSSRVYEMTGYGLVASFRIHIRVLGDLPFAFYILGDRYKYVLFWRI